MEADFNRIGTSIYSAMIGKPVAAPFVKMPSALVPVVFAGVNGFVPDLLAARPRITGMAEVQDMAGTLELALRLRPDQARPGSQRLHGLERNYLIRALNRDL